MKGTKRRASVLLVPPGTSERHNEARIDREDLNAADVLRENVSDTIEIPDSYVDAERIGLNI